MGASLGAPTLCHRDRREAASAGAVGEAGWASIFLISIFHPVFPLSVSPPSLGSSNHKSLLGAITGAVLQWEGGRIDSRVEDERREG